MPQYLKWGPFVVQTDWVLLAVSCLVGYVAMRWLTRQTQYRDGAIADSFVNVLVIALLVWKFSPLLFEPEMLWENPKLVLIMSGHAIGWWVGFGAGLAYLVWKLRRTGVPIQFAGDLLAVGLAAAVLTYQLFDWQYGASASVPWGISLDDPDIAYHPVNVYMAIVTLPVLVWLIRSRSTIGSGTMFANFLLYWGLGIMVVSFFMRKSEWWLGLSALQFGCLLMLAAGIALSVRLDRTKREPL